MTLTNASSLSNGKHTRPPGGGTYRRITYILMDAIKSGVYSVAKVCKHCTRKRTQPTESVPSPVGLTSYAPLHARTRVCQWSPRGHAHHNGPRATHFTKTWTKRNGKQLSPPKTPSQLVRTCVTLRMNVRIHKRRIANCSASEQSGKLNHSQCR